MSSVYPRLNVLFVDFITVCSIRLFNGIVFIWSAIWINFPYWAFLGKYDKETSENIHYFVPGPSPRVFPKIPTESPKEQGQEGPGNTAAQSHMFVLLESPGVKLPVSWQKNQRAVGGQSGDICWCRIRHGGNGPGLGLPMGHSGGSFRDGHLLFHQMNMWEESQPCAGRLAGTRRSTVSSQH